MSALMGIDIGTGSTKAELMDDRGRTWSASSAGYGIASPNQGWAEQDPQVWMAAAHEAAARVWEQAELPSGTPVTVGFTGQMHSTVLVDADGQVLRPSILWCDTRAEGQAAALGAAMPDMARITGNSPLAAFTLSHLMWLTEHEPHTLARATHLMLPKDYLRYRLTGSVSTDWTDASATNMLDIRTRAWSRAVIDAAGIDERLLPSVLPPDEIVGELTGLIPGSGPTLAVVGVGDQFAETVAAGVVEPGPLVVVLGTSGAVLEVRDRPSEGVFCHAQADRWLRLDSLHSAGLSLTWLRDVMAPGTPMDTLTAEAATVPRGADGLTFLPFLVGDRFGHDQERRAGFVGAKQRHTRAHFVRAVLEGVAMELRRIATHRMGIARPPSLVLKGGGAQSDLWAAITGEVFGAPLSVATRSAAAGALDIAGVAAGRWTYGQAAANVSRAPIEPTTEAVRDYEILYSHYVDLVEILDQRAA